MTTSPAAPEPSRTLAVLFGASRWPEFEGLEDEQGGRTYSAAANSLRDYLLSEDGLGLPKDNLLDLFDSAAGVVEQDKQIRHFILTKCKEAATIQDLIVMFVGHGSTMQNDKFIFVLGSTSRDQREITAYKSETLGRTLKKSAPTVRKWIILDCCAAARAYGDFQPASEPEKILELDAETSFPRDGAAFYAACSSDNAAYNDPKTGSRMFTAALTDVLKRGDAGLGDRLTLSEVAALTRKEINRRHGPDAVRPYIGDPDQRKGELTEFPFFPNAARRKAGAEAQLKALESGIASLRDSMSTQLEAFGQRLDEQQLRHEALASLVSGQAAAPQIERQSLAEPDNYRAELDDIRIRVKTLRLGEQRWWDETRSGYFISYCILWASIGILLFEIGLSGIMFGNGPTSNLWSVAATMQGGLGIAAGLVFLFCMATHFRSSTPAGGGEDSAELEALLRTNERFRKIYLSRYNHTGFGLLHRHMITAAGFISMVAALIGLGLAYLSMAPRFA